MQNASFSIKNVNYNPFLKERRGGEEEKEGRLRKEKKDSRKSLISRCLNN
jgi:hypothetical protein